MHLRRKGSEADAAQGAGQRRLEVLMLSLLIAVLVIAGVLCLRTDPSGARGFKGLPLRVTIERMAFVDYRQKLDNELLGNGVSYSSLGFERENVITTDYAGRYDDCYVVSVERIGADLTLRAQAVSEGSNWDTLLRTPSSRDYDHPSGLWALTVMQRNGRNAMSEWAWFNDDGTGWRGEGGYDASSETLESLQENGVPCTWHVAQVEGSQLVVLDYEGGQTIIKVTI